MFGLSLMIFRSYFTISLIRDKNRNCSRAYLVPEDENKQVHSDMKYTWQIPIFEKGYEKDPAVVAKEAIQEAARNKSDVVLVDTAGRMQVILFSSYKKKIS